MKRLILLFTVAVALATVTLAARKHESPIAKLPTKQAVVWADSVMKVLTPEQRIEQLMIPRVDYKGDAKGKTAIETLIRKHHVGGILLGKGTIRDYATIINEAQSVSTVPLMITLDGEWGLAMRVTDAPQFPYNMTLGAISDTGLIYDYGREIGRECRALGINVDFAPVLDVNSNPANPVIGYRSFGQNPQRVAELGLAYSQGLESAGVLSVAKHFPGHGNTTTDSHKALPVISAKRSELDKIDLHPFKQYINAGLSGMMVGHLDVPALDRSGKPASLSAKITTDILKKQLHFKGLVFTDALAMKGAGAKRNNCVEALIAGADVLLQPANIDSDIKAIQQAVKTGKIKQSAIDERCRKLLVYKYLLGLNRIKPADVGAVGEIINSAEARSLIGRLADASVTLLRNDGDLLPLRDLGHKRIAIALIGEKKGCRFAEYCLRYAPANVVSVNGSVISESQLKQLDEADVVVAAVFSDKPWAINTLAKIRPLGNVAGVFFLNPYKMTAFGETLTELPALVTLYQNLPSLQISAAEAIFGGVNVDGRLPVNAKYVGKCGEGIRLKKVRLGFSTPGTVGFSSDLGNRIDSIVETAITEGAMTGCQVLVARNGEIVIDKAFGRIDTSDDSPAVTTSTLFDLASVTKTHATLAGLMKAFDEGLVKLDDRVGYHIASLDSTAKGDVTVEELLFHESGMPPVINTYRLAFDPQSYEGSLLSSRNTDPYTIKIGAKEYGNSQARLRSDIYSTKADDTFCYTVADKIHTSQQGIDLFMEAVHNAPLRSKSYEYSCLNFILLKELQESATGVDLDQWIDTEIYGPLGAWHALYMPLQKFDRDETAATEDDRFLRRQKIHGYVHDEMAAFAGGIQGNAGLFANAGDVAKLCQLWLNGGTYGGERLLSEKTVKLFTTRHSKSGRRGLGFDLLGNYSSITTDKTGKNAYGHTGFTGTSWWVDPSQNLIIVFLSNRVNPSRDNPSWNRLNPRGAVVREVYNSLECK